MDEGERVLAAPLPQEVLTEGARGAPVERGWPSTKGASERTRQLREAPLEGAPTTLELEERAWRALLPAQDDTWSPKNTSQSGGTSSKIGHLPAPIPAPPSHLPEPPF